MNDSLRYFIEKHWTDSVFVWTCILLLLVITKLTCLFDAMLCIFIYLFIYLMRHVVCHQHSYSMWFLRFIGCLCKMLFVILLIINIKRIVGLYPRLPTVLPRLPSRLGGGEGEGTHPLPLHSSRWLKLSPVRCNPPPVFYSVSFVMEQTDGGHTETNKNRQTDGQTDRKRHVETRVIILLVWGQAPANDWS